MLTVRGPDGNTIPYPEFVPALDAAALQADRRALRRLGAQARARGTQARHVTDKMPSNYYFAGLIHLALPNAKIIHTVRDPVDTCISCFSKLFSAEQNHTYDLGELGRYYKRYERLMAHWRRVLPAGRILDVRYEDVVADLEKAGAAHHRLLRPALGRALPLVPRDRPADPHRERDAGAPADLQQRRRPLARLRAAARAALDRARLEGCAAARRPGRSAATGLTCFLLHPPLALCKFRQVGLIQQTNTKIDPRRNE